MQRFYAEAIVPIIWNDDENIWEVDPASMTYGPAHVTANGIVWTDELDQEGEEQWSRADAANFPTYDELAMGLGGIVRRNTSSNLRMMVGVQVRRVMPDLAPEVIDRLVTVLMPVFASVDDNAHLRGVAEARGIRL